MRNCNRSTMKSPAVNERQKHVSKLRLTSCNGISKQRKIIVLQADTRQMSIYSQRIIGSELPGTKMFAEFFSSNLKVR